MSDQSTDAMVELIKVSKTYHPNIRALEDVSISIRSGEAAELSPCMKKSIDPRTGIKVFKSLSFISFPL